MFFPAHKCLIMLAIFIFLQYHFEHATSCSKPFNCLLPNDPRQMQAPPTVSGTFLSCLCLLPAVALTPPPPLSRSHYHIASSWSSIISSVLFLLLKCPVSHATRAYLSPYPSSKTHLKCCIVHTFWVINLSLLGALY